ncbi:MAG TPA: rhodanese-like domain-containing protein [Pyrinomonadaceae bacterium]|jgi:predicted sulfurtransferase
MRSFTLRTVASLLVLLLLAGSAFAQTKKRKKKTVKAAASKQTKTPQTTNTGDPVPPPQPPDHGDGVQRIGPAEARAALEKGKAIIVDVRGLESYNIGHIKGALSIPVNAISARMSELPRNKLIITYCS